MLSAGACRHDTALRPFLVWRDRGGERIVFSLGDRTAATVGRRTANDIVLKGDPDASRAHAELKLVGGDWMVIDDGMSTNGTFVNGHRLHERRRLHDGDVLRFGSTLVEFRNPAQGQSEVTAMGPIRVTLDDLNTSQRRVLIALCRPYKEADPYAKPATNREIAGEVFLTVEAVKQNLRGLFRRFEINHLPHNEKRVRLVELTLESGLISRGEL